MTADISSTPRLSATTLGARRTNVAAPGYDRDAVSIGQLHLGLGAFHRAHQAVYAERVLEAGHAGWGVAAVAMRSRGLLEQLRRQDRLYTVVERGAEGDRAAIIGSLAAALHLDDDRAAIWRLVEDPKLRIISLTVTEKGYGHEPATGLLDRGNASVAADLAAPDGEPQSVVGILARACAIRHRIGAPLTILCCDNMETNGETLRGLVLEMARAWDAGLADWIAAEIGFPNCMVDRIVPAATEETAALARGLTGLEDGAALATEPFTQWVIEDRFATGRPPWELGGATFVEDIAPWQRLKLAVLNGPHSAIAYIGQLAGLETVGDAMAEPAVAEFVEALMRREILGAITPPAEADTQAYVAALLERFGNPRLRHRTEQIAMDGSQKIPVRWLPVIEAARAKGAMPARLCTALAAWFVYLAGRSESGAALRINDPLAETLGRRTTGEPAELVAALLAERAVFPSWLGEDAALVAHIVEAVGAIRSRGVIAALKAATM